MDDQPDLMAAMREENKEKQLQMLQHALNWYSTYINAWNPLIAHDDNYEQFELFHHGSIPQMNCKDNKIPRDSRRVYKPEKHPSKKRIYDFNDMESQIKDFLDCMNAFNRHTECTEKQCKRVRNQKVTCRFGFPIKPKDMNQLELI